MGNCLMAQNRKLGYGKKLRGLGNPQPSPKDRYTRDNKVRSMDAVQRLNVSGPEKF